VMPAPNPSVNTAAERNAGRRLSDRHA
jgi:hypothetical protein